MLTKDFLCNRLNFFLNLLVLFKKVRENRGIGARSFDQLDILSTYKNLTSGNLLCDKWQVDEWEVDKMAQHQKILNVRQGRLVLSNNLPVLVKKLTGNFIEI